MASVAPTAFMALSHAPPLREALSGVFGSISLAAWICLLVSSPSCSRLGSLAGFLTRSTRHEADIDAAQLPQLIANYKAQSADGLSMGFLLIWLLGDATNLAGKKPASHARVSELASVLVLGSKLSWPSCLKHRALSCFARWRRRVLFQLKSSPRHAWHSSTSLTLFR